MIAKDEDACAVFPAVSTAQVRQFREDKGMSQEEFAKAYGLSLHEVHQIEGDEVKLVNLKQLVRDILGLRK
jgi:DNA-binding transcriptional regulator YiaG